MRHHFTKSERLALKVMAALHLEFTEMESTSIQRGRWVQATTTMQNIQMRGIARIVTFTVDDRSSPMHAGVQVLLKGMETKTFLPGSTSIETTWKIDQIQMGYRSEEDVVWRQLHIPDDSCIPISMQFPHYLMRNAAPVPSTDA